MSVVARLWAPLTLGAVSTVVVGWAINILTAGHAAWGWWLVLAFGTLGLIASGIWVYAAEKDHRNRRESSPVIQQDSGTAQQAASDGGTNVAINAEDGSAAAWQMGDVNLGQQRKKNRATVD